MLDINLIRETPDIVRKALKDRQMDPSPVDAILQLDEKRRALLGQVEVLKAERNTVSKEIGQNERGSSPTVQDRGDACGRRQDRRVR